jgi:ring-1,2-phenylacetyl-CoA epoxidase subunit PaaC
MTNDFPAQEETEDRWAFGTGFEDPYEVVELTAPLAGDRTAVLAACLALGDDALVSSHRLQEWLTRLPELEEETAVANIALDLLGQARLLLNRAGHVEGAGRDEDQLAFFREAHEFRNVRLVEPADAGFAGLVVRLLVFSTWRLALMRRLCGFTDPALAAIATRSVPELRYHADYAAEWVVRLGDGTPLSHERTQAALTVVWPYVDELFMDDAALAGLDAADGDPSALRAEVDAHVDAVLAAATLTRPSIPPATWPGARSGRQGVHTEALGLLLAELQSVARAHPGGSW